MPLSRGMGLAETPDDMQGTESGPCANEDRELWRRDIGYHLSESIHVTSSGAIGINVGGHVIVMSLSKWHALGQLRIALDNILND